MPTSNELSAYTAWTTWSIDIGSYSKSHKVSSDASIRDSLDHSCSFGAYASAVAALRIMREKGRITISM